MTPKVVRANRSAWRHEFLPVLVGALLCLAVGISGCSDDGEPGEPMNPSGPMADLSTQITAGGSPFLGAAVSTNLEELGYVEREYVASGVAVSYRSSLPLAGDGVWTFEEDGSAPYRTRVLVRRPANSAHFSGTVIVEWLNVSGGLDANPSYASVEEELTRQGHAWVGVSAQLIGVEGGPVLVIAPGGEGFVGVGLKAIDPARYGTLAHPGDGFSFDICTQVARAVRAGGSAMGGLKPRRVIAAGESQSAIALVTYYNGVQPLSQAFDGFFVHSRGATSLPLVGPGEYADLARSFGSTPVRLRTDLNAPVLVLQAEGDVTGLLASATVRQPDSNKLRLWEVAGTAHADAHLLGPLADAIDCGGPINNGPLHLVAKAALRGLDTWVRTGEVPPEAPRLTVAGTQIRRRHCAGRHTYSAGRRTGRCPFRRTTAERRSAVSPARFDKASAGAASRRALCLACRL